MIDLIYKSEMILSVQKYTQKYTIVHLMDVLPEGYEYSMKDWPLHITVADVFAIDGNSTHVLERLRDMLSTFSPLQTRVNGEDWFGDDKSIHAMLLEKTNEFQQLHDEIVTVLKQFGAKFNNPEFTEDGFKPHSTVQNDGKLEIGDNLTIDTITLIDMFPNDDFKKRKVLGTIKFDE